MSTYTVSDYLLDRITIQDAINRMVWYVDRGEWDELSTVFADELVMDYSKSFLSQLHDPSDNFPVASLLGGEPTREHHESQPGTNLERLEYMDSTMHAITGIILDLPQPTADKPIQPPMETTATRSALITLRRNATYGDPIVQSGGNYTFTLIRSSPNSTGNLWRISFMKADVSFSKGNAGVAKNPRPAWDGFEFESFRKFHCMSKKKNFVSTSD
ncbi:hypothetical protein C8R44DRAFT_868777 [Mycena epipterygia]|nr:hypothetical protein C8R44DRAFT_868777 [Mycena epipterygia]